MLYLFDLLSQNMTLMKSCFFLISDSHCVKEYVFSTVVVQDINPVETFKDISGPKDISIWPNSALAVNKRLKAFHIFI